MIAERVRLYRQAGVTTLLAKLGGDADERLSNLEQLLEVVGTTAEQPPTSP
jgi:hypothetical protein